MCYQANDTRSHTRCRRLVIIILPRSVKTLAYCLVLLKYFQPSAAPDRFISVEYAFIANQTRLHILDHIYHHNNVLSIYFPLLLSRVLFPLLMIASFSVEYAVMNEGRNNALTIYTPQSGSFELLQRVDEQSARQ